jgi:predicted nucleic acid-binding protein
MPVSFFDTNVLVYLASADPAKADRAEQVLAGGGTISVQVLNELATIARRKMHLSWTETTDLLATIRALVAVVPLTIETHEVGLSLAQRFGLSIYDAMIAASAMLSGCDTLWSEDMQHGMALDNGLRIRNPFRPD